MLQWLALESLFAKARFRYFDFTEGECAHKRLLAAGSINGANVALLKPCLINLLMAHSHIHFERFTQSLGDLLERFDLKTRFKRWLRFGCRWRSASR